MITTDTRLSRDLNNCPANSVIIGASRVTLDLDGHTIDGVGAGIGVNNSGGYDRVTVKDGRVHQFMDGIRLQNAEENRLWRLRVAVNAGQGIALEMSDDNRDDRAEQGQRERRPRDQGRRGSHRRRRQRGRAQRQRRSVHERLLLVGNSTIGEPRCTAGFAATKHARRAAPRCE